MLAEEAKLDIRLEYASVDFFGSWKVGEKHGQRYTCEEKYSLEPRLLGKPVTSAIEVEETFVPSVNWNEFHDTFN